MWNEEEIRREIKTINDRLTILKEYPNDAPNPFGFEDVENGKANLRYRKKKLQERLKEIKAEREYDHAKSRALSRIFDRDNNGIYPSDIGQDWRWRVENDIVYCRIEDKEFSEPIIIEKK